MFDLEKFKTGKYYVYLPAQELYDEAMEFLDSNGFTWRSGKCMKYEDFWNRHGYDTCISYDLCGVSIDSSDYFKKNKEKKSLVLNVPSLCGEGLFLREDGHILQKEQISDMVKSPNHYIGELGLEVEEVLRNFIPRYEDSYVAHRIASALEYLLRSPLKNGKQDLEKARYNITQALEHLDKNE